MAEATGMSLRFVNRAETSPQNITLESLENLAQSLSIDAHMLLQTADEAHPRGSFAIGSIDEAIRILRSVRTTLTKE